MTIIPYNISHLYLYHHPPPPPDPLPRPLKRTQTPHTQTKKEEKKHQIQTFFLFQKNLKKESETLWSPISILTLSLSSLLFCVFVFEVVFVLLLVFRIGGLQRFGQTANWKGRDCRQWEYDHRWEWLEKRGLGRWDSCCSANFGPNFGTWLAIRFESPLSTRHGHHRRRPRSWLGQGWSTSGRWLWTSLHLSSHMTLCFFAKMNKERVRTMDGKKKVVFDVFTIVYYDLKFGNVEKFHLIWTNVPTRWSSFNSFDLVNTKIKNWIQYRNRHTRFCLIHSDFYLFSRFFFFFLKI